MQKSILITGCSTGIGLCAAEILHARGYRVFATARKESDVLKLKAKGINSLVMDVDHSDSIRSGLEEILKQTNGKLDALFNNAGFGQTGAMDNITRDRMRAQFETNVFGPPMELITLVLPIMRKQGYGRIIQNTSVLGVIAMPYYGAYSASKFALEALSHTLRQELIDTNIFVSIIAPGPIKTQFRKNAYKNLQTTPGMAKKLEDYFSANEDEEPMFSLSPETVVNKLIHALESTHPKARYNIGFPAKLFTLLRHLLCDKAIDWLTVKITRLQEG